MSLWEKDVPILRAQMGMGEVAHGIPLASEHISAALARAGVVCPVHHKSIVPALALWLEVTKQNGLWPMEVQ